MDNLLTRQDVADFLKITLRTFDKLRKQDVFVKPITIGVLLRWREADVQAWLDQKLADAIAIGATFEAYHRALDNPEPRSGYSATSTIVKACDDAEDN